MLLYNHFIKLFFKTYFMESLLEIAVHTEKSTKIVK